MRRNSILNPFSGVMYPNFLALTSSGSINVSILYIDMDPMGLRGAKLLGHLKENAKLEVSN